MFKGEIEMKTTNEADERKKVFWSDLMSLVVVIAVTFAFLLLLLLFLPFFSHHFFNQRSSLAFCFVSEAFMSHYLFALQWEINETWRLNLKSSCLVVWLTMKKTHYEGESVCVCVTVDMTVVYILVLRWKRTNIKWILFYFHYGSNSIFVTSCDSKVRWLFIDETSQDCINDFTITFKTLTSIQTKRTVCTQIHSTDGNVKSGYYQYNHEQNVCFSYFTNVSEKIKKNPLKWYDICNEWMT